MNNYPYIIAGLPDIALDFREGNFDFDALCSQIKEYCGDKRVERLIDWLTFGLKDENASPHFYSAVAKQSSRFLKEYFKFDKALREAKVAHLTNKPYDRETFAKAFDEPNLIDREKAIDILKWQKISELTTFELFNIDQVLGFLAKAKIAERWSRLDQKTGEEMFRTMVAEVRGTFKGIKDIQI